MSLVRRRLRNNLLRLRGHLYIKKPSTSDWTEYEVLADSACPHCRIRNAT